MNEPEERTAVITLDYLGEMLTTELIVKGELPSNYYLMAKAFYIEEDTLYTLVEIHKETIH